MDYWSLTLGRIYLRSAIDTSESMPTFAPVNQKFFINLGCLLSLQPVSCSLSIVVVSQLSSAIFFLSTCQKAGRDRRWRQEKRQESKVPSYSSCKKATYIDNQKLLIGREGDIMQTEGTKLQRDRLRLNLKMSQVCLYTYLKSFQFLSLPFSLFFFLNKKLGSYIGHMKINAKSTHCHLAINWG